MTITHRTETYKMVKLLCSQLNYSLTSYGLSYKKGLSIYWKHEYDKLMRHKIEKCELQKIIFNKHNIPRHLQFELFKY